MSDKKPTPDSTEPVKIEMTPMIDVVFLLLVFFMISMKFRVSEGFLEARLPTDAGMSRVVGTPPEDVTLRLQLLEANPQALVDLSRRGQPLPDGTLQAESRFRVRFFVGEVPLVDLTQQTTLVDGQPTTTIQWSNRNRPVHNAAAVHARLLQLHRADPDMPLKIDPDRGVPYSALVAALEAGRRAGFTDVRFAGDTRRPR